MKAQERQNPPAESLRELELPALKQRFGRCLGTVDLGGAGLREVVRELLHRGLTRQQIRRCATEAGYSDGHARNVLNQILREIGSRSRKTGAGRRTPQESLALLASARQLHGDLAEKFLLAAYRAGTAEKKAAHQQAQPALSII